MNVVVLGLNFGWSVPAGSPRRSSNDSRGMPSAANTLPNADMLK